MFLDEYRKHVAAGDYEANPIQEQAAELLQQVHDGLMNPPGAATRLLRALNLARPADPKTGLYLWGSVGSGKTTMLNLFFRSLPIAEKRRLHFHRLMRYVHMTCKELEEQGRDNPLDLIARDMASRYRIICLDEFFVNDIGDAMVLSGFLTGLWNQGVVLVATSNTHPDNLYADGLQRERFLPAIAAIKTHMAIFEVSSDFDYRTAHVKDAAIYHLTCDPHAEQAMATHFENMSMGHERRDTTIEIEHRTIRVNRLSHNAIWFDFVPLCKGPRSTRDYIEIARCFSTILVSNIPTFDDSTNDSARRFVHMVDEFYDRGVILIASAAAEPQQLYQGQALRAEFARTASRLIEMRSQEYLAQPHATH